MDRAAAYVRRAGLACVAMFSVALGVAAIWVVARPDVIGRLPTSTLFGVVGLMVLPLASVGALVLDRRAILARGAVRRESAEPAVRFIGDPTPVEAPAAAKAATTHAADSGRHHAGRHRHHRAAMPAQD